jgi:hypothetical protein
MTIDLTTPSGAIRRHSTDPALTKGLIGLGGQKARPLLMQTGSSNSFFSPADQNGLLRSFTGTAVSLNLSTSLEDQSVAAARCPHGGARTGDLPIARLAS